MDTAQLAALLRLIANLQLAVDTLQAENAELRAQADDHAAKKDGK